MKPRALAPIAAKRSGVVVGATSGTSASPCSSHASLHLRAFSERQVGHDQPARAGLRQALHERLRAGGETMFA